MGTGLPIFSLIIILLPFAVESSEYIILFYWLGENINSQFLLVLSLIVYCTIPPSLRTVIFTTINPRTMLHFLFSIYKHYGVFFNKTAMCLTQQNFYYYLCFLPLIIFYHEWHDNPVIWTSTVQYCSSVFAATGCCRLLLLLLLL